MLFGHGCAKYKTSETTTTCQPSALKMPQNCPKSHHLIHEGRKYSLHYEANGWRLRSRSTRWPADFRTGTSNLKMAEKAARDWLVKRGADPVHSRKGGGTLEGLAAVYLATPKRTKTKPAEGNVSRLRTICRVALGKELESVTCREVGPELWRAYQKAALEVKGHAFDLVTRRPENAAINAAIRCARCLFLKAMLPHYRAAGLDVRPDAGDAVILPMPYMPPKTLDDGALVTAWERLRGEDVRLWLAVGLARFAGLRRAEIAACRGGWIEETDGALSIALRDRPEEQWWTKTGRPYRALVINPVLAEHLRECAKSPDSFVVPGPPEIADRAHWFAHAPQEWLRRQGVPGLKPLHRLRGAYADAVASLTADAVTARLAGVKAAQEALGHTSSAVTEKHYLSQL